MAKKTMEEEFDNTSPWASNASRYPEDMELRVHGFRIESRPKKGPVLWRDKDGKLWTHSEAIELVRGKL